MECGGRAAVVEVGRHLELAGRTRLLFLASHRGIKGWRIDSDVVLAPNVLRQIKRKAISIVQLEGGIAVEDLVAGRF